MLYYIPKPDPKRAAKSLLGWLAPFWPAVFLLAVLLLTPAGALAQENTAPATGSTYLVQFAPETSEAERAAWIEGLGGTLLSWMPQIGVAEVRLDDNVGSSMAAAGAATGPVIHLEADIPVSGEVIIADPAYNNPDQGYAQHMLQLAAAWDVTEGSSETVIAIVDSGINMQHPEFKGRITPGYDFVNADNDPSDDHGHGTHVAGVAAAGLDGAGTVGVCPRCKLMPVKVLNERNGGTWSLVTKGILYAVDNGADVINLSLGATVSSAALENALRYAEAHDVVVVAAAGNMGSKLNFYPAAIPSAIAVGGTDRDDKRWPQSNYGEFVDVTAPAVSIYSAYHDLVNSTGYAYMSGTSMATPFVSGLVGLVLSRQPDLSSKEVAELIGESTTDLGPAGKDIEYGSGRIDVYKALLAANDGVVPTAPETDNTGGDNGGKAGGNNGSGNGHYLYLPSVAAGARTR